MHDQVLTYGSDNCSSEEDGVWHVPGCGGGCNVVDREDSAVVGSDRDCD